MLTIRKHSVNVIIKSAVKLKIMLTGGGGGSRIPKSCLRNMDMLPNIRGIRARENRKSALPPSGRTGLSNVLRACSYVTGFSCGLESDVGGRNEGARGCTICPQEHGHWGVELLPFS